MHVHIRAYIDKCIHITHPQMPRKESAKNKERNKETVPCHSKCNSKSNGSLGRPDVRHQYINYRATDKKDAYFAEENALYARETQTYRHRLGGPELPLGYRYPV